MKKAIILVSFGTSYQETRHKTIDNIETIVKKKFAGSLVLTAFTSGFILKKLTKSERPALSVTDALNIVKENTIQEVILQPTHLLPGEEFEKILSCAKKYVKDFDVIKIGRPLLNSVSDCRKVLSAMEKEVNRDSDEAVIYMGHGTDHYANYIYPALNFILRQNGIVGTAVATVEGYPLLKDCFNIVEGYKKICLMPMMFVSGDHAINDMAGDDEDSWKSILVKKGFHVRTILKGLGELDAVNEIYLKHIEDAGKIEEIKL